MRTVTNLCQGWIFRGTDRTSAGEPVCLPHTWNADDGQDGGNDYLRGTCWYAREVPGSLLGKDERAYLRFDGAACSATVYVDGALARIHEGGFSTFFVEVTDALRHAGAEGTALVEVACDNGANDRIYPQAADFTFYGGIYREVSLVHVPAAAHIGLTTDGSCGVTVAPEVTLGAAGEPAYAKVGVTVEVAGEAAEVAVALEDATGAACAQSVLPVADGVASGALSLPEAHLWDGVNDPYLYTCVATLACGDEVRARFGCRTFEVDPQRGFILNGRPYPLRGVSRHQDRLGVGNALAPEHHAEDVAIIREMGANTVRLAHYQHDQHFYDLCDEAGLAVWAEIPYITAHMPAGRDNTIVQMRELVRQNINHPSIVCWGLSNEITAATLADDSLMENHHALNDLAHKLDPSRPTTMAHVFMLEPDSDLINLPDIGSYNLYYGWYVGELADNERFLDAYHAAHPERAMGLSEYGADANPAFQASEPTQGDYSEQYQCVYHEHMLSMIEERPWLWATHVWNMFDFAADGRDEGGAHGRNQKGLVSFDRRLRKDAFYLHKAYWSDEPFVHVCGRRYTERPERTTTVTVYSNAPSVELLVDGTSAGRAEGHRVFRFTVELNGEGEHRIEAHAQAADGASLSDAIEVRHVNEPNPAYRLSAPAPVTNWFDAGELDPACFSVKDTLGDLQSNPRTAAIIGAVMERAAASRGDVATKAMNNPVLKRMMARRTLESLIVQAGADAVPPEAIAELNRMLQQVPKA